MYRIFTALIAAIALAGCASWLGEAETPETRAFRTVGAYAYVAVPAKNYAAYEGADAAVLDRVCRLDQAFHDAMMTASSARRSGADDVTTYFAAMSRALASFQLQLIGTAELLVDPEEIAGRALVWAVVGTQSVAEMRTFRTGYLKPKLDAMDTLQADPTPEEWEELEGIATVNHEAIQARCAPAPI